MSVSEPNPKDFSNGGFDIVEAERLAALIRPAWESADDGDGAPTASIHALGAQAASDTVIDGIPTLSVGEEPRAAAALPPSSPSLDTRAPTRPQPTAAGLGGEGDGAAALRAPSSGQAPPSGRRAPDSSRSPGDAAFAHANEATRTEDWGSTRIPTTGVAWKIGACLAVAAVLVGVGVKVVGGSTDADSTDRHPSSAAAGSGHPSSAAAGSSTAGRPSDAPPPTATVRAADLPEPQPPAASAVTADPASRAPAPKETTAPTKPASPPPKTGGGKKRGDGIIRETPF